MHRTLYKKWHEPAVPHIVSRCFLYHVKKITVFYFFIMSPPFPLRASQDRDLTCRLVQVAELMSLFPPEDLISCSLLLLHTASQRHLSRRHLCPPPPNCLRLLTPLPSSIFNGPDLGSVRSAHSSRRLMKTFWTEETLEIYLSLFVSVSCFNSVFTALLFAFWEAHASIFWLGPVASSQKLKTNFGSFPTWFYFISAETSN